MSEKSVKWKEKYPSIVIKVKQVELQEIGGVDTKDWCWLMETHKRIVLTDEKGGKFIAAIINGLSEMIKPGNEYTIWFGYTDHFDRYVEILCVESKN
jgi:hypothetical protein